MTDVLIPADLWSDTDEAAISVWLYDAGDQVAAGAVIAEIMVEKSSFELLSPSGGVLAIMVEAEVPVTKGQIVAQIAT
jgi:pyruvate/2-oxoglutarate dehydrogenase complex dihydrolipoamide acyltransferase (E2) component